jgi:hypothetical protein
VDFFTGFTQTELSDLRDRLIQLRRACLGPELDARGALILSYAIRWLYFKIAQRPYEEPVD